MTRDERRQELEALRAGPCTRPGSWGVHYFDPDDTRRCIYCHCSLDIVDDDLDEDADGKPTTAEE